MHIHTHPYFRMSLEREARLIGQTPGPSTTPSSTPPPGPSDRITPTNAPTIMAQTRNRLTELRGQITRVEREPLDEQARATMLQNTHTQLDALRLQLTPTGTPALPDATQENERRTLVTELQAEQETLTQKIQRLRALAGNSVYQFFSNTGLGTPFRWIGGLFTGLGPLFRDMGQLLEPIGTAIASPFKNLGPGAAGLFAGIVRKFNPSWADAMQRYAEGDRPFAELDRAFRDAMATATGASAGRQLQARSAQTAPAERQLRSLSDRARSAGWDLTRFATETLNSITGTGEITYVQLLAAAQRLPIAGTSVSPTSTVAERPAQTQNLALDTYADAAPITVVNGDTLIFPSNTINLTGGITVEGTSVTLAAGTTAGSGGTAVNVPDVSGTSWISLQLFSPSSPITPNMTFGKLEVRIINRPITRPVTRTIRVGGKTIRIQYA